MTTPTPAMTPEVMKRLAFIRMLHQQGTAQSYQAAPLNCTCILAFHDAVELFLLLAGEHLAVNIPETGKFDNRYFDNLAKHPDGKLSGRKGVRRLNDHRNNFKHAHAWPSRDAIEDARADTMAFFEDNTPRVFGVSYDAIDMADLIPQEHARDIVKQAQEKEISDDTVEAMALLVDAFDDLFRGKPWSDTEGAYTFGPRIRRSLRDVDIHRVLEHGRGKAAIPTAKAGDLAGQIATTTEAVIALQSAMQVLASGIDYPQYDRFQVLTPHVAYTMSGDRRVAHHQNYAPSKEDFEYCKRFVISSALRLVEVEGHRSAPPWLT